MGADGVLAVPTDPIIPFIEGDGTGVDIWPAARLVLDAAAARYGHTVEWMEVLAGEKAYNETGEWLPRGTVEAFTEYLIGIKGHSPPRSAGAFAASTWLSARSWTSTCASARCGGSRACRRRSSTPS